VKPLPSEDFFCLFFTFSNNKPLNYPNSTANSYTNATRFDNSSQKFHDCYYFTKIICPLDFLLIEVHTTALTTEAEKTG